MFTNLKHVKYTHIKNYGFYLKPLFLQMQGAGGGCHPWKLHSGSANCVLSNLAGSDHNRDLTFAVWCSLQATEQTGVDPWNHIQMKGQNQRHNIFF